MKIEIKKEDFGKITVELEEDISTTQKKYIESLGFLQLTCGIPRDQDDDKFDQFLEILTEAINKSKDLYGDNIDEFDPFEQF